MTRIECLAKLNLLGIYTVNKFYRQYPFKHPFTVILFDTVHGKSRVGYIEYDDPKMGNYVTTPYKSYVKLLNAAIKLSKKEKKTKWIEKNVSLN